MSDLSLIPQQTENQMFRQELAEIALLHGARYGLRACAAVCVPPVRRRQLASDFPVVECEWVHVVGPLRHRCVY